MEAREKPFRSFDHVFDRNARISVLSSNNRMVGGIKLEDDSVTRRHCQTVRLEFIRGFAHSDGVGLTAIRGLRNLCGAG